MDIDYSHFTSNKLPREIMKMIDLFEKLKPKLKNIVFEELKLGNVIYDVSEGYPKLDSIFVSMQYEFKKTHNIDKVRFTELTDPHYWKGEYSLGEPVHLVTCPF